MAASRKLEFYKEGEKQPESHLKLTAHTKTITGAQLANERDAGRLRLLDPCDYAKKLCDWKFVTNASTSRDYFSIDPNMDTTTLMCVRAEEMKLRIELVSKGVYGMTEADYDLPFPIPHNVERCAFLHDMGTLQGIYVRKLDGSKTTLTALAMLADRPWEIGTGNIFQFGTAHRYATNQENRGDDFEMGEYLITMPDGFDVCIERNSFPEINDAASWTMDYREQLEKALGRRVVYQWRRRYYVCATCSRRSMHTGFVADTKGIVHLYYDRNVSPERCENPEPVLTFNYCGPQCVPDQDEVKRVCALASAAYEEATEKEHAHNLALLALPPAEMAGSLVVAGAAAAAVSKK